MKLFKRKKVEVNQDKIETPTQMLVNRFLSNKLGVIGLVMFIVITTVIIGVWAYVKFTKFNLAKLDFDNAYLSPRPGFWFGTDKYGRDFFIRAILGGTISLQVGLLTTVVSIGIGVIIGGIAGYYGGKLDMLLMRFGEIVSAIPFLPIAITIAVIMAKSPAKVRLYTTMTLLGAIAWPNLARMVRGQILSLREQEFMVATRALGIRNRDQILKHLIPNVFAFIIVAATNSFAGAILSEATLSFLGLSVSEPIPTWGSLVESASNMITMQNYWWLWIIPGMLLLFLIMSVNLIGEGVRDAVDPKANVKYVEQKKDSRWKSLFKTKKVTS